VPEARDPNPIPGGRPLFIDNQAGNTLAAAITASVASLEAGGAVLHGLDIASAFFSLRGFEIVHRAIDRVPRVRLLLGAEPTPEAGRPLHRAGDPPEPRFTEAQIKAGLTAVEHGLARDRDLLPFDATSDAAIRALLSAVSSGRFEVRRYERQFLHAKAFLFRAPDGGLISGSSNFTAGGLRSNLELNLGNYDAALVARVQQWFDELWLDSVPFDLAAIYDRLLAEFEPYEIYLRVLLALYGHELGDEAEATTGSPEQIPVTSFQRHGVWRTMRIIERYGGALVSDGVGLGKTFLAGEIIAHYRRRRQRVLLVCPAALRDTTWKRFIEKYQLFVKCVSFEELAGDKRLNPEANGDKIGDHLDEIQLVVVDEAHNYRNPSSSHRAAVLRALLRGPRRDLLLLTATPVNNSLWDLYHLIRFFVKQDAVLMAQGVRSIRDRFNAASRVDPFNLNPDVLFPIIDAVTVKRTRGFIKKHYPNELIKLPDGTTQQIVFPKPMASSIAYDLEAAAPGLLDEIENALMPAHGAPSLTMARYKPEVYSKGSAAPIPDPAIVGLLRSGLLKRFESSAHAFLRTCDLMIREHELFLKALDQGTVLFKDSVKEAAASDDDDDAIDDLIRDADHAEPAAMFDVASLRRDVAADLSQLQSFKRRAAKIERRNDPKLAALIEELKRIVKAARDDAASDEEERRNRKVLIFSSFADTVEWVEEHLRRIVEQVPALRAYAGRVVFVTGDRSGPQVSRDQAVRGFAPESATLAGAGDDNFDILVTTDVLAEGMNLQQCRNIVNYDLPWNPMRLVQRHGRIDRIGSHHSRVFLRTFFPDRQLDRLLRLEQRVRHKLAQAAASIGVETTPILLGAESDRSFAETVEEISKLRLGDAAIYEAGGTKGAAQTGEEYRQELRRALERMGDQIRSLPWKAGSGIARGKVRGHVFCGVVERADGTSRVMLRFVPFGDPAAPLEKELGTCLRLIECTDHTPRHMPDDLRFGAADSWSRAQQDMHREWMYETDPANLQPRVPPVNARAAAFLKANSAGMDQSEMEQVADALEAPCAVREQQALREVLDRPGLDASARVRELVRVVKELGLEASTPPMPLPPIDRDDVRLLCWMAVDSEP